jgi:energy-converting hydrogenase Eha subunit F
MIKEGVCMEQLYEVEIKSKSILRENQRGFITYFRGGNPETIVSNCKILYPQFTQADDEPVVNITPISEVEYTERLLGKQIVQKQEVVGTHADVMKVEDYESLGD